MNPGDFERRMRPFIALQAAVSALGGFAGVFVQAQHGNAATARYAAVMLTAIALSIVLSYALGPRLRLSGRRLLRVGFALPALLLWWAEGRPDVLALAVGGFIGLTWGARHALELQLLADRERDAYAAHAVALAVAVALATTLAVSAVLTAFGEARWPVYRLFALLALAGALFAAARVPDSPPVALQSPWAVIRQRQYLACLPLFFLESGLMGVGLVLTASGAVRSLGSASHYGWVASAATLVGALALRAARSQRHSGNRSGWMLGACVGVVAAAALLGASVAWPTLFVMHLLLQAMVSPFWMASEHVLNQRALDIQGSVGDRIVAREGALGLFRLLALGGFWFATQALDDGPRLVVGAALMALAAIMEFRLGRTWLAQAAGAAR